MPYGEKIKELMLEAVEEAKKSKSEDEGIHPKVGAILADRDLNILHRAYRGEKAGCHAEYLCIKKAKEARKDLNDCMLFVTLEPCTARGPGKEACTKHILESGIKKVFIGMLDPNPAICGRGETRLRFDLDVERFPLEIIREIESINGDFIEAHKKEHLSERSLYVKMQIHQIMGDYLVRQGFPLDADLPIDVDLTIDDIYEICNSASVSSAKTGKDVYEIVLEARAEAFDKKYADRTYDDDGRGLGDYWKKSIRRILEEMGARNLDDRRIIVVGIGNGLEGVDLYSNCMNLIAIDIGKRSLEQAQSVLPNATMLRAPAENLEDIKSNSQDIYISLRTYQSTYFDRNAAIREAYRIVRQGGVVILSVANGFLEQGSLIQGLLIPGTSVVDRNLGFHIANQIRSRMALLNFEEIGMCTSLDEIYIFGRRGK